MSQNGDGPISAQPPAQSVLDQLLSVRYFVPLRQRRSLTKLPDPPTRTSRTRGGSTFKFTLARFFSEHATCKHKPKVQQDTRTESYYLSIGVRASVHPSLGCRRRGATSAHPAIQTNAGLTPEVRSEAKCAGYPHRPWSSPPPGAGHQHLPVRGRREVLPLSTISPLMRKGAVHQHSSGGCWLSAPSSPPGAGNPHSGPRPNPFPT